MYESGEKNELTYSRIKHTTIIKNRNNDFVNEEVGLGISAKKVLIKVMSSVVVNLLSLNLNTTTVVTQFPHIMRNKFILLV